MKLLEGNVVAIDKDHEKITGLHVLTADGSTRQSAGHCVR